MFYSRFLLSKKGPLGTIWVAAHCHKRLKKDQVKQTDIPSSVDKILQDAVPEVTYRIIAYLLLGVVRIFSKKVDFLFADCCNARDSLNHLAGLKKGSKSSEAKQPSTHSISIPKRFELDAFDLEVLVDQDISCYHVRAREEIMLADAWKEGVDWANKEYYIDGGTSFESCSSIYTPVRDVFSPHLMDIDLDVTPSHVMSNLESGKEILPGIQFSLEEHLEQMIFGEAEKESAFDIPSNEGNESDGQQIRNPDTGEAAELFKVRNKNQVRNHESSGEQLRNHESEKESGTDMPPYERHESHGEQIMNPDAGETTEIEDLLDKEQRTEEHCESMFPLEESLESMSSSQMGKESRVHLPTNLDCQHDGEQIKYPGVGISLKEPETPVRSFDKQLSVVESEETRLSEISPLSNQIPVNPPISISEYASPDSKSQGAISRDLMAVRTPSIKERAKVMKKRKCLFDETVVLSNDVIRHWIGNSSELVSKRRKAPHTAFHSWQAHKMSNLPQSFIEPLIPCNSVAFKSLVSPRNFINRREHVETVEVFSTKINTESPVNQVVVESSLKERSREQTPIAPATPVTHSTTLRLHEVCGVAKPLPLECASSSEIMPTPNEDLDLDTGWMDDEEINASAGDIHVKQRCSVRSRNVAKYLHEKLQRQRKQKGETFINLMQVLKGKTRKESARLFYEILVLKTGDYIDARQEHDFGDILVTESSKLRDSFDADGVVVVGSGA